MKLTSGIVLSSIECAFIFLLGDYGWWQGSCRIILGNEWLDYFLLLENSKSSWSCCSGIVLRLKQRWRPHWNRRSRGGHYSSTTSRQNFLLLSEHFSSEVIILISIIILDFGWKKKYNDAYLYRNIVIIENPHTVHTTHRESFKKSNWVF